jgi:hypothetical protein
MTCVSRPTIRVARKYKADPTMQAALVSGLSDVEAARLAACSCSNSGQHSITALMAAPHKQLGKSKHILQSNQIVQINWIAEILMCFPCGLHSVTYRQCQAQSTQKCCLLPVGIVLLSCTSLVRATPRTKHHSYTRACQLCIAYTSYGVLFASLVQARSLSCTIVVTAVYYIVFVHPGSRNW